MLPQDWRVLKKRGDCNQAGPYGPSKVQRVSVSPVSCLEKKASASQSFPEFPGRFKWLLARQGKAKVESQDVLGVTGKFGLGVQNEAGQRLTEFWQENALIIASIHFQLHKRRLYMWTSPDGYYWNLIDYILCSWRWRSSIQSAKTRPGADCGSGHELLIAKFRLKLKA